MYSDMIFCPKSSVHLPKTLKKEFFITSKLKTTAVRPWMKFSGVSLWYFIAIYLFLPLLAGFLPYTVYASAISGLGDINDDCIINSLDWSLMGSKWLTSDIPADLNKDGIVNSLDWSIMGANWLKTCTVSPPPPPPVSELVPPYPSDFFAIGDRVRISPDPVSVRSAPSPSSSLLGTQPVASMGSVIGGPTYTDGSWWWQINFDSGVDGWVEEDWLTRFDVLSPESGGQVSVIVGLMMSSPLLDESEMTQSEVDSQRLAVASVEDRLISDLGQRNYTLIDKMETIPSVTLSVDSSALTFLGTLSYVRSIRQNSFMRESQAVTSGSGGSVGGTPASPKVLAASTTGGGSVIVVIDSGVDYSHPAFYAGQVIQTAGACFSELGLCLGGKKSAFGTGAGDPCPDLNLCYHGTSAAGAAVAVAPGAQIISIRLGGLASNPVACESTAACRIFTDNDVNKALNYVYKTLRTQYNIAAVNVSSVGLTPDGRVAVYKETCDKYFPVDKMIYKQLRSAGIAVVAGAGNNSRTASIGSPACISYVVGVSGLSAQGNSLWANSNANRHAKLAAQGEAVRVPVFKNSEKTWDLLNGTSLAAPQVAGAFAVLKGVSGASLASKIATLQVTSVPVKDKRDSDPKMQSVQCGMNLAQAQARISEVFKTIDVPDFDEEWLEDINKCGQIVASGYIAGIGTLGEDSLQGRLISNGQISTIPCPGGTCLWPDAIWPKGINDFGAISGAVPDTRTQRKGFVKTDSTNETFTVGSGGTFAADINNYYGVSGTNGKGFLWQGGGNIVLSVGGSFSHDAVNDLNQIAGPLDDPNAPGGVSGYIWDNGGLRTSLRFPGVNGTSYFTGINNTLDNPDQPHSVNNLGQIVGCNQTAGSGFLYSKGTFKAVNYPGARWTCLYGINDGGYATGGYYDAGNVQHGFMVNLNLLP